ncbi:MAG: hypothetical protein C0451_13885 [Comamonadaceae bacterium]|nr:hypothetical protein [Comamonadaceae bacterium]
MLKSSSLGAPLYDQLQHAHPLPQAELDGMHKPDRSKLPAIQREGPDVDDLQDLIAARTHFAPHLPLAHFIVMKLASIPVNAHTVPDPRLSTEVADHGLSRLGSGQTATVWQADLGLATGAWAFKPEPDGTEVPDAGIDTGIQRLRPGERLGPNFTGRTVASAKTAQALEFHGAPESRPVVFRDPESGRLMYGAASRLVKGSMLQEAEGKPAVLALDVATVDRLQALEEGERQTVIDRVARRMGFVSATWDSIGQNITLTPGTEFRRNLDWTDPDLRRSLADGALWAALTAQADNHAGNYMQEPEGPEADRRGRPGLRRPGPTEHRHPRRRPPPPRIRSGRRLRPGGADGAAAGRADPARREGPSRPAARLPRPRALRP